VTLLVVRLGALGDIVHTVPAVAAITRAMPGVRIDWLVEQKHRPVLDLFDLDVRPIAIEGGSVGAFLGAMRGLRANEYEVALDFQGLLKSAITSFWFGHSFPLMMPPPVRTRFGCLRPSTDAIQSSVLSTFPEPFSTVCPGV